MGWKRVRSCFLWLLVVLGPPLVVSGAMVLLDLVQVVQTGTCPPAPPDIPAYPCTVGNYLLRVTLGPWALIGHVTICLGWLVLFAFLFVAYKVVVRIARPPQEEI